jgi:hypothetical protein
VLALAWSLRREAAMTNVTHIARVIEWFLRYRGLIVDGDRTTWKSIRVVLTQRRAMWR